MQSFTTHSYDGFSRQGYQCHAHSECARGRRQRDQNMFFDTRRGWVEVETIAKGQLDLPGWKIVGKDVAGIVAGDLNEEN